MKRSLKRVYWTASILSMLLAMVAIFFMVDMKLDDSKKLTRALLQASGSWTVEARDDLQNLAVDIAASAPPLRVTFLLNSGMVVADSEADPLSMPNHLNRPEIQQLKTQEIGESLRISDTQDTITFFAAKRVTPWLILRLCYPLSDMLNLLFFYGVGLILLCVILYLMQRRTYSRFAKRMIQQLEEVRQMLEGVSGTRKAIFPEFQPALDHIAYLADRLNTDLAEVTRTARLRADFVANASHELRSPLTSIAGFAEMLSEDMADDPEEQALCLNMICNECRRMLSVIEDILNQSRAERPHEQPAGPVNVTAIAEEIIQALAPQAAQKNITLRVVGEMTVEGWEKDLWEMLYNLAGNAIRYGREGGWAEIRLSEKRIAVADNGVGILEEHLPYLFEQFYRVDETRDMGAGGTGLGLSIVRTLAQRSGAAVRAESSYGEGSTFFVEW